jgi:phenylacetate-CoA ligase
VGVTVIEHLPSLVLRYFERAKELGIEIKQTELRMIVGVGEGWAEAYKKKVEEEHGVPFLTSYGLYEFGHIATECEQRQGMHIIGDQFIVEVIDPETLQVLNAGQEGELLVTTLMADAMPLIRYRTGDVGSLLPYEPCPCGRTHPKISMVKGRVTQIFEIRGKKLLPIDI